MIPLFALLAASPVFVTLTKAVGAWISGEKDAPPSVADMDAAAAEQLAAWGVPLVMLPVNTSPTGASAKAAQAYRLADPTLEDRGVRLLVAQSMLESGGGSGFNWGKDGQSNGLSCFNMGAEQCGPGGQGGADYTCIPHDDTHADGTHYTGQYKCFADLQHAAAGHLRLLAGGRYPRALAALRSGDVFEYVDGLHEGGWYEGIGATNELRVGHYLAGILGRLPTIDQAIGGLPPADKRAAGVEVVAAGAGVAALATWGAMHLWNAAHQRHEPVNVIQPAAPVAPAPKASAPAPKASAPKATPHAAPKAAPAYPPGDLPADLPAELANLPADPAQAWAQAGSMFTSTQNPGDIARAPAAPDVGPPQYRMGGIGATVGIVGATILGVEALKAGAELLYEETHAQPRRMSGAPGSQRLAGLLLDAVRRGRALHMDAFVELPVPSMDAVVTVLRRAPRVYVEGYVSPLVMPCGYADQIEICNQAGLISPTREIVQAAWDQDYTWRIAPVTLWQPGADLAMQTVEYAALATLTGRPGMPSIDQQLKALNAPPDAVYRTEGKSWILSPVADASGQIGQLQRGTCLWGWLKLDGHPVQGYGWKHDDQWCAYADAVPADLVQRTARTMTADERQAHGATASDRRAGETFDVLDYYRAAMPAAMQPILDKYDTRRA